MPFTITLATVDDVELSFESLPFGTGSTVLIKRVYSLHPVGQLQDALEETINDYEIWCAPSGHPSINFSSDEDRVLFSLKYAGARS